MKSFSKLILGLFMFFALTACGASVRELETEVLNLFNEDAYETGLYATEVILVHVKDNQYEGLITITDGEDTEKFDINVVYDGESFMYEIPDFLE